MVAYRSLAIHQTQQKDKRASLPNINWGRGRLNQYESFLSFSAKFCRLNQLTPKQFRTFWASLFHENANNMQYMANLLNEPFSVVKSVFSNRYLDWSILTSNLVVYRDWQDDLAYCPKCLAEGYHANFHESCWLAKCPIHNIDLLSEKIHYSSNVKLDRCLITITRLFDSFCPEWAIINGKYNFCSSIGSGQYIKFLKWRISAEESLLKPGHSILATVGSKEILDYYPNRKFIGECSQLMVLTKTGAIGNIENNLRHLFKKTILSTKVDVNYFGIKSREEIDAITKCFSIKDLIELYMLSIIFNKNQSAHLSLAEFAVDSLKIRHPVENCNCIWGIKRSGEIVKFLPGEIKYYGNYLCPYAAAANEIYENWLDKASIIDNKSKNYDVLTHVAKTIGIVSAAYDLSQKYNPKIQYTFSRYLQKALDAILKEMVMAHVDELNYWLSEIEKGGTPENRNVLAPNTFIVKSRNHGLVIVSWSALFDLI